MKKIPVLLIVLLLLPAIAAVGGFIPVDMAPGRFQPAGVVDSGATAREMAPRRITHDLRLLKYRGSAYSVIDPASVVGQHPIVGNLTERHVQSSTKI